MKKHIVILLLFLLVSFPFLVSGGGIQIPNPLEVETFEALVGLILDFLLDVAIVLAPIIFIYAAFMYLTAAGSPEKIQKANKALLWAVVGLTLVLLANGAASVIADILGIGPPPPPVP